MAVERWFLIPDVVLRDPGKTELEMTWEQACKNHHTAASILLAGMAEVLDAAQLQRQTNEEQHGY